MITAGIDRHKHHDFECALYQFGNALYIQKADYQRPSKQVAIMALTGGETGG